jgi:lycopene cyclase CruP
MLDNLRQVDHLWHSLRQGTLPVPTVVQESQELLGGVDWDVVICGGTLGILVGAALAQRGWRVALLERGKLQGREQEWNISRRELHTFLELGLLTAAELEQAIATEYNPARVSFLGGQDIWVRDVLNIGIDPVYLLETLKQKFLHWGGQLFEHNPFDRAIVHPDGITITASTSHLPSPIPHPSFKARLLLDAMGHFSPIVRQARQGQKPDAVCLVVGSCATGFAQNESGDLIASFTPMQNQCQYFWEAFPARDGRTTYLFTYLDADPSRPSLEQLFEDYLHLLPTYQKVELQQLQFKRALFGIFPCYRKSPLNPKWHRILPIGDSSGSQSPLSFGGFGAMVRHLNRLTQGIHEALQSEALDRRSLALLQPYQPNLSVTWLFQKAMSVGVEQKIAPNQINELLVGVFEQMAHLGDPVLQPFLQDVVQFPALLQTLARTSLVHPGLVMRVIPQVGMGNLLDWMVHYASLAGYSVLNPVGRNLKPWLKNLSPSQQYHWYRWLDAWNYGSGGDFEHDRSYSPFPGCKVQ